MNSNCDKSCRYGTSSCSSDFIVIDSKFPNETPLAMSYVSFQEWEETYKENKGLEVGTIFPSLNLPYLQNTQQGCGRYYYAK